jgi:Ca-activated chloride channel family protein
MRRLGLALLALLLLAAAPRRPSVGILAPMQGEPLFGEVEVRVAVRPAGAAIRRVEVYLDGVQVGVLAKPPWRIAIDVGEGNMEHRIEVVATDANGVTGSATLRSGTIAVQEQIEVALRPVFVRVERGGNLVRELRREDFTVFDGGVRQQVITFERGDVPFTAALLLDASASMHGGRLETAIQAVSAFARAMLPNDEAKLLLFADRVLLETPFTNAPSFLTLGLPMIEAGGGTALNDALYLALARLEPRSGRKVVLILSDGVDVESVLSMSSIRTLARRSGVILYWLRLGGEGDTSLQAFTPWRDADAHRRERRLLNDSVVETGGRILDVGRIEQAQGALAAVLQELREQYVLGYYPSSSLGSGSWHDVRVEVAGGGAVRTQRGYTEP